MTAPIRILAWPAFKNRAKNPYTHLLYSHMNGVHVDEFSIGNLRDRYDVWHMHWPETFLNPGTTGVGAAFKTQLILSLMDFARCRGTKIIWTVHNLKAHDGRYPRLERRFWRAFLRRIDGFICLSKSGMRLALHTFPQLGHLPGFVIPHGLYRGEYPMDRNLDHRRTLDIAADAKVVLFFGMIRKYKNVPGLIRVFRGLSDSDAVLCIAGKLLNDCGPSVRDAAGNDPRVRLHTQHVPAQEVQNYFGAADLVVLPYREILNSGTALLALSFDKPVLVPRQGAMAELQSLVGDDWVRTYQGELSTAELTDALVWSRPKHRGEFPPMGSLDCSRLAQETVEAYKIVLSHSGGDYKQSIPANHAERSTESSREYHKNAIRNLQVLDD